MKDEQTGYLKRCVCVDVVGTVWRKDFEGTSKDETVELHLPQAPVDFFLFGEEDGLTYGVQLPHSEHLGSVSSEVRVRVC